MKTFLLFLLGVVVGIGGTWAYYAGISNPRLVTETEITTKEQFEQSQVAKQMFLTATVTSVSDATIQATTEKNDQETSILIQIGANTKLYTQTNDDGASKNPITLSELAPGSIITVVTSGIIDLTQPVNATEIIKL